MFASVPAVLIHWDVPTQTRYSNAFCPFIGFIHQKYKIEILWKLFGQTYIVPNVLNRPEQTHKSIANAHRRASKYLYWWLFGFGSYNLTITFFAVFISSIQLKL